MSSHPERWVYCFRMVVTEEMALFPWNPYQIIDGRDLNSMQHLISNAKFMKCSTAKIPVTNSHKQNMPFKEGNASQINPICKRETPLKSTV